MKKWKLSILFLIFFWNQSVQSQFLDTDNLDSLVDNKSDQEKFDEALKQNTLFVALRYQGQGVDFTHNERASSSTFTSLNQKINLTIHSAELALGKEFFPSNLFGITFTGLGAFGQGRQKDVTESPQYFYKNKGSSFYYGAEISLNFNLFFDSLKLQPFIGAGYTLEDQEFELTYSLAGTLFSEYNINYESQNTLQSLFAGIRFIDPRMQVFSTFMIKYNNYSDQDLTANGNLNNENYLFTKVADVKRDDINIKIGLGFLF